MKRMRNLLIGVLLVALAVGFTGGLRGVTSATELSFTKLISLIAPSVVKIRCVFPTEDPDIVEVITGSGFIISADGDVVTKWHVVKRAILEKAAIQVYLPKLGERDYSIDLENPYSATVKKVNPFHDLALLNIPMTFRQVWFGNSDNVNLGDGTFVMGYPAPTGEFTITHGQITNIFKVKGTVQNLLIDGKIYQLLPSKLVDEEGRPVRIAIDEEGKTPIIVLVELNEESVVVAVLAIAGLPEPPEEVVVEIPQEVERVYLETDAKSYKGGSGGPMFNLSGQVLGISEYSEIDVSGIRITVTIDGQQFQLIEAEHRHNEAPMFSTSNEAESVLGIGD